MKTELNSTFSSFNSSALQHEESPPLRQRLEVEMEAAIADERSALLAVCSAFSLSERQDMEDVIELFRLNLHLAAKISVLKAID